MQMVFWQIQYCDITLYSSSMIKWVRLDALLNWCGIDQLQKILSFKDACVQIVSDPVVSVHSQKNE